jgi:hypothetical protein
MKKKYNCPVNNKSPFQPLHPGEVIMSEAKSPGEVINMSLYERAEQCYINKEINEYVKLILEYLEKTQKYCHISYVRLLRFLQMGNFDKELITWLESHTDNSYVLDFLGDICYFKHDIHTANDYFEKSAEYGNIHALYNIGYICSINTINEDYINLMKSRDFFYKSGVKGHLKGILDLYDLDYKNEQDQELFRLYKDHLIDLDDMVSLQSRKNFDIMNITLDKKYFRPQIVKDWLVMRVEYYNKILYDYFSENQYIPKELLNLIVEHI